MRVKIWVHVGCMVLLFGLGLYLVGSVSWRLALGIFLMFWANNIETRVKELARVRRSSLSVDGFLAELLSGTGGRSS